MRYPDGLTVRPIALAGDGPAADGPDVDLAWQVAAAAEAAVLAGRQPQEETTREDVRTLLAGPEADRRGHRLVLRGTRPVGLLVLEVVPAGRTVFADAYAVPPDRPDDGAGPDPLLMALLADGIDTARERATADPGPGLPPDADPYQPHPDAWQVDAGAYAADERYRAALAASGFRCVRRHWRMAVDLAGPGSEAVEPPPPPGVTRVVARDPQRTRALHEVFRASFAEHFGTVDRSYQEWIATVRALPGCDPDRWWLALLDQEPVGLCLLDDSRAAAGYGYVRTLGVVPSARGRGIGRWLLRCAVADAARRGRTGLALTVDSENPTGATALYESEGMRAVEIVDAWRRPV